MKILGLTISKKLLIAIIAGILVISGGITTVILLNGNDKKEEVKQPEEKDENKENTEDTKNTLMLKEDLNIEINSETNLLSLIKESNEVEIVSKDVKIDTTKLGEQELTIKYLVGEEEKEQTIKINIVDKTAPVIEAKEKVTTDEGKKINLLKNVKVSDNSKEEIKATVEGKYDINEEGEYTLKYVAEDSSGNKTEKEFTLVVKKKEEETKEETTTKEEETTSKEEQQKEEAEVETPSTPTYRYTAEEVKAKLESGFKEYISDGSPNVDDEAELCNGGICQAYYEGCVLHCWAHSWSIDTSKNTITLVNAVDFPVETTCGDGWCGTDYEWAKYTSTYNYVTNKVTYNDSAYKTFVNNLCKKEYDEMVADGITPTWYDEMGEEVVATDVESCAKYWGPSYSSEAFFQKQMNTILNNGGLTSEDLGVLK